MGRAAQLRVKGGPPRAVQVAQAEQFCKRGRWSEVTKKCHKPGSPAQIEPEPEGLRAGAAHGVDLNRFSSDFKGQATSAIGITPPAQMLLNRFSGLKPEKKWGFFVIS